MIISASRRTDIPAFYSEWFMNRIHAGYCLVANPFNPRQISRVSLAPDDVDAIAFWSKNPAPLMPHLDELDAMGHRYYFQYTLCGYSAELEPHVPPVEERIATFRELAHRLSPLRVIWRYDPIVVSDYTDVDFHKRTFERIASALEGMTTRVVISLVDYYGKVRRNLKPLEGAGWQFAEYTGAETESRDLLRWMAAAAQEHGLKIQCCSETVNLADLGIRPGKCIDDGLLNEVWGVPLTTKDPGQRSACLCAISKDIGANDTCLHGCRYCYATNSLAAAAARRRQHDPHSPILVGPAPPDEKRSAAHDTSPTPDGEVQQSLF
jgi:DNA repair photolyase